MHDAGPISPSEIVTFHRNVCGGSSLAVPVPMQETPPLLLLVSPRHLFLQNVITWSAPAAAFPICMRCAFLFRSHPKYRVVRAGPLLSGDLGAAARPSAKSSIDQDVAREMLRELDSAATTVE